MYTWIELDRTAFSENISHFVSLLGAERFAPVLKANAYGHGLQQIYQMLSDHMPRWLCFNYVDEATQIHRWGYKGRMLVMGPTHVADFEQAAAIGADVFLNSHDHLDYWLKMSKKPSAHVKIDTGMSRQGFLPEESDVVSRRLKPYASQVQGICTHFSNVEDVIEPEYSQLQLQLFETARQVFAANGIRPPFSHCASSASALLLPQSRFDLTRVGISFYGMWPSKTTRLSFLQQNKSLFPLKPVLSWYTKVAQIKAVKAGKYIGYGCAYRALHDMMVAVLPVGYYEGVPRMISEHNAYVLIKGRPCPQIGRVCMNMIMVDVTHVPSISIDDRVTLIGKDSVTDDSGTKTTEEISAIDFAGWAQTINYEITTRLHPQIRREIVG